MFQVERDGKLETITMARPWVGRFLYTTKAFLVEKVLIEAGCKAVSTAFLEWARERRPAACLVSYHHEDHAGNAIRMRSELGIPVYGAPATADLVSRGYPLEPYRRLVWSKPDWGGIERAGTVVEAGRLRFEMITTPGHSVDHVAFYLADRGWLFTSDVYLSSRQRYLRHDEDLVLHIQSLRRLLSLDFGPILCSHRGFLRDGRDRLSRKLDFFQNLVGEIRRLGARGLEASEIASRTLGREGFLHYFTFGQFSKRHLVDQALRAKEASPD